MTRSARSVIGWSAIVIQRIALGKNLGARDNDVPLTVNLIREKPLSSRPGQCRRLTHRPNYFFFCAPTDSSARSLGLCASFESTLPLRASTWTAAIFFVKGVTISIDQISWPFSCASFALLTFPPGTFVNATLSACARVTLACELGDVGGLSVAKVVP